MSSLIVRPAFPVRDAPPARSVSPPRGARRCAARPPAPSTGSGQGAGSSGSRGRRAPRSFAPVGPASVQAIGTSRRLASGNTNRNWRRRCRYIRLRTARRRPLKGCASRMMVTKSGRPSGWVPLSGRFEDSRSDEPQTPPDGHLTNLTCAQTPSRDRQRRSRAVHLPPWCRAGLAKPLSGRVPEVVGGESGRR